MSDYGIVHEGRVFTPNDTPNVDPAANDARNKDLERVELGIWAEGPAVFNAYVVEGDKVTTFLGTEIGRVIKSSTYKVSTRWPSYTMRCVTVRGNNGVTYVGRYGSDWAQLIRLRRKKSK